MVSGIFRSRGLFLLGSLESQRSTLLVIDDTMCVTTSTGPKYVLALSVKDGTVK
jgi:hypothetical protein